MYLGKDKQGKEYAIKIIDLSGCGDKERDRRFADYKRELDLLQKVESRYVAKFYGHASDQDNHLHYLLLEYCNSDLQKLIGRRHILPEKQAEVIIMHIFKAQYELKLQNIIHRDLKPSNIGLHFDALV